MALSPGGDEELSSAHGEHPHTPTKHPHSWVRGSSKHALLLGAEGTGLPPSILERTRRVRIAMSTGFDSLNVAVASGIALYEVTRPSRQSVPLLLREEGFFSSGATPREDGADAIGEAGKHVGEGGEPA